MNRVLGIAAIIAGGITLSLTANGGQIVTCGTWSGCTTHTEVPQNFAEITLILFAVGIALIAVGIYLLVPKQADSSFPKTDKGMI